MKKLVLLALLVSVLAALFCFRVAWLMDLPIDDGQTERLDDQE